MTLRLAHQMCNAAKIIPDNKSGTPGLAIWVPPAIARWSISHAMRHVYQCRGRSTERCGAPGKNANHTHDVVSNVVNVSTFFILRSRKANANNVANADSAIRWMAAMALARRDIPAYYPACRNSHIKISERENCDIFRVTAS